MRKVIGLVVLMIQFSCAKPPQDSVTFKIQYHPDKTYNQTTVRTSQSILKYSGKEKSLLRLRDRGIQNPSFTNRKSQTESVIKTGRPITGTSFPVTIKIIRTVCDDGKKEIPDGTVFNGQSIGGNLPVIESVASNGLDYNSKAALVQAMQNSFSQFTFPEKKLKIGEQFSIDRPGSIPMEGSKIKTVVTTTYKLISISNGMAGFEISQVYSMNPILMDNSFKGTGNGKGKLLYDIDNMMIVNFTLNTEMEINKRLDSFDFDLKTSSGFVQTTSISAK